MISFLNTQERGWAMDNWLVTARKAAKASKRDFAEAVGLDLNEYNYIESHPGRLELNQIGALTRTMSKELARQRWRA